MNKLVFLITLLITGLSTPAQAFSKVGHQLVCEIAYQQLSSVNQGKLDNLLRLTPPDHQRIINKYARVKKTSPVTFNNACLWADAIKGDRSLGIVYNKFKPWHYMNVERDTLVVTADSCTENCVLQAITFHQQQLKAKKITWEKTQALMFLGHWVGDIHQPMHVSYASDFGGNKLKIKWLSDSKTQSKDKRIMKCKNMHVLWDDCLLRTWHRKTHDKTLFKEHLTTLNYQLKKLPAEQLTVIQASQPWEWATESLSITRNSAVKYCQNQTDNNFCLPFKVKTMYLLPEYHQKFSPVVLERIMYAGLRLGKILKESL